MNRIPFVAFVLVLVFGTCSSSAQVLAPAVKGQECDANREEKDVLPIATIGMPHNTSTCTPIDDGINDLNHGNFDSAQEKFNSMFYRYRDGERATQCANLLGMAMLYQGKYLDAEPWFTRALKRAKKYNNDDEVANSLYGLARVALEKREWKSDSLCKDSLEIRKHLHGENYASLADNYSLLALIYSPRKNKVTEAEGLANTAIEIAKHSSGAESLEMMRALESLGAVYIVEKRYSDLELLLQEALQIARKHYGDNHIKVAEFLEYLANCQTTTGKTVNSKSNYDKARLIRESNKMTAQKFRWLPGNSNCKNIILHGWPVELTSANGITVTATIVGRIAKFVRIDVGLLNTSDSPVNFNPADIKLVMYDPSVADPEQVDVAKWANSIVRRAKIGAALSEFGSTLNEICASLQTVSTTVLSNSSGTFSAVGNVYGNNGFANVSSSGNYSGLTTTVIKQPDYLARARAIQNTERVRLANAQSLAEAERIASTIRSTIVQATTVSPKGDVAGAIYFARKAKVRNFLVQVPVGNSVFEFPFPFKDPW